MTSPDLNFPGGAYTSSTVFSQQSVTQASVGKAQASDMATLLDQLKLTFINNLLGGFGDVVKAIGAAIDKFISDLVFGLKNVTGGFIDLTGFLKNTDTVAKGAASIAVTSQQQSQAAQQQASLATDKAQQALNAVDGISGVVGYACFASTGQSGGGGKSVAPFTSQIGPMVGVTRGDSGVGAGGLKLLSKGLWRADAMQFFGNYTLGFNQIDMDILVYAPDGSLYVQRFNHNENAGQVTLTSLVSFVTPAAGYQVVVQTQAAVGRGVFGGNSYSSLNVTKISNETS